MHCSAVLLKCRGELPARQGDLSTYPRDLAEQGQIKLLGIVSERFGLVLRVGEHALGRIQLTEADQCVRVGRLCPPGEFQVTALIGQRDSALEARQRFVLQVPRLSSVGCFDDLELQAGSEE
jgi:hypothetical protein